MESAWVQKWVNGDTKLRSAANAEDAERALLMFHGALEDYFRHAVANDSRTPLALAKRAASGRRTTMRRLVGCMEGLGGITASQAERIRTASLPRNRVAHGGYANVAEVRSYVREYGQLVGEVLSIKEALRRKRLRDLEEARRQLSEATRIVEFCEQRLADLQRFQRSARIVFGAVMLVLAPVFAVCPMSILGGLVTGAVHLADRTWGLGVEDPTLLTVFYIASACAGALLSLALALNYATEPDDDKIQQTLSEIKNATNRARRAAAQIDALTVGPDAFSSAKAETKELPDCTSFGAEGSHCVITASTLSETAQRQREIRVAIAAVLVFVVLPLCLIAGMAAVR